MLHEDDAPPTFFEYNFFKKYMPHLGIFMEPVDIRYRVVMKTKSKVGLVSLYVVFTDL